MSIEYSRRILSVFLLVSVMSLPAAAQEPGAPSPRELILTTALEPVTTGAAVEQLPAAPAKASDAPAPNTYHLTLEEAKCRTLQNSVLLEMASQQINAKSFALDAARKDFLPKLLSSFVYFHFDSDLGTVVTTPGIFNPATAISVPIIEQDSSIFTTAAIQPITPLLKVRQAVNINQAEVASAQAQKQFARRELTKGAEQLYIGLLMVQRIQAGLALAATGTQQMIAATNSPDAKIALIQIQQIQVGVNNQAVTLRDQLNQLVNLPPCTELQLDDLPLPHILFACPGDVVAAAVATSPKIREAQMQVEKAEGAVRLAEADYVPSVNAYGFYVNQDATPSIQDGFTGVGVSASYLLEWGKKNDTLRQWKATECLARKNLRKEIQDIELNAAKAFHEANRAQEALDYAQQLAKLNAEAKLPSDPFQLKYVLKDRLEAELGAIKAELDYRNALVELASISGQCE